VLRKSTLIHMENAPETVNPDDLKQTLIATVPGVRDVHDVHCWSLTTGQTMLTLHLVLEVEADPSRVLREAKHVLAQRFEVSHSALQLESEECPDAV
jgi:cobalt-zinc-cadmium efflux system protein